MIKQELLPAAPSGFAHLAKRARTSQPSEQSVQKAEDSSISQPSQRRPWSHAEAGSTYPCDIRLSWCSLADSCGDGLLCQSRGSGPHLGALIIQSVADRTSLVKPMCFCAVGAQCTAALG
mmetsp:Transcript_100478/g.244392  ORF Transcript_100478/g.244392 Transcript_100478/m.244392 type:complete len:120 (-) Transcript_100478:24-383(-)